MKKTRPYLVYGRAEPRLWGDRRRDKNPGYQVLATSENLDPQLHDKLKSMTILDASETHRLWFIDNDASLPLWSYCEIGDGEFAIGRTIFLRNKEYLDRAGRIASVSHVIVITHDEMKQLKGSPFPIIHSNSDIFVTSIEDLIALVGDGIERPSIEFGDLANQYQTVPLEEINELNGFDPDSIDRLVKDNFYARCPIIVRGSYHDTISFLEMLFSISGQAVNPSLTFSMLCRGEKYGSTRIQVGRRHSEKIFVAIDTKTVSFPKNPMVLSSISSNIGKTTASVNHGAEFNSKGPLSDLQTRLKNQPKLVQLTAIFLIFLIGYNCLRTYQGDGIVLRKESRDTDCLIEVEGNHSEDDLQLKTDLIFSLVEPFRLPFFSTDEQLSRCAQYDPSRGMFSPKSNDRLCFEISDFITIGDLIRVLYPEDVRILQREKDEGKRAEIIMNLMKSPNFSNPARDPSMPLQSSDLLELKARVGREVAEQFIDKYESSLDFQYSHGLPVFEEIVQSELHFNIANRSVAYRCVSQEEHYNPVSAQELDWIEHKAFRLVRRPVFDRCQLGCAEINDNQ